MKLAQEKINTQFQNGGSRNNLTYLGLQGLIEEELQISGEKMVYSIESTDEMGYLFEKYKVSSTPHTAYENKLQVK